MRARGCLEVPPRIKEGRFALEQRVNEEFGAGHAEHERHVGWRCVAVGVVVGVVGIGQVGPPALLAGGTSRRRVGSRQRPVFPTHTARGHVGRVRGVSESTVRSFEVGQEALGNQGHRCGLGAVFVLEERFIGELRQLIVVVWVPNSRRRIQINTRLVPVFNGVGVHLHGRTRHRFPIGKVDGSVDEILQIIAVSDFNINAFIAVGKCGHIGRSKGGEKHQQYEEYWLRFSVCFV